MNQHRAPIVLKGVAAMLHLRKLTEIPVSGS
jgi:hypothetical protein